MEEPNIFEIIRKLEGYSQNLKENNQIGNSKLMLGTAELIKMLAWTGSQQDKYSKIIVKLTWAIVVLTVLMLLGLCLQIGIAVFYK